MKRIRISLLGKVAIAIAAGILFGQFLPNGIARIFVTFNALFGEFLSFSIPLIIVGLVVPAIGDLGKGAGKLLLLTALIAYGSTIFSGFFTFFSGAAIFPGILPTHTETGSFRQSGKCDADRLFPGGHAPFDGCDDRPDSLVCRWIRAFAYPRSNPAWCLRRL